MDQLTKKSIKPWIRFYTQAFNILFQEGEKILNELINCSTEKTEGISINLLYRKMVELAYGQMSLSKNNEFILMKSLNRESLETNLFLKYFKQENTKERSISYQIHGINERIKHLKTFLPDHPTYEVYQQGLESLRVGKLNPTSGNILEIKTEIQRLELLIKSEPLGEIYKKYFENNPKLKWYSINNKGINSIKDLSKNLGYELIYHTLYKSYSEYIHGYNLVKKDIVQYSSVTGRIEVFGIPGPPFELAHDFIFFQNMFKEASLSAVDCLKLENPQILTGLFERTKAHFQINQVQVGQEFLTKEHIYIFPKNRK
ncbi:DUF5677 domain-containing protein [Aquiflexum sp.]|uniref:DUF5677 domain-containing protein n=1 Tax=Aquiflexum sp. TaxID=1872584 RepID=UPI003593AF72